MKGEILLANIYMARGAVEKQNLLAQAFIGDMKIPSKRELFTEYDSYYLPCTNELESAFADAHELEGIHRSPMIGDVVILESEEEWEAYIITSTGYQKIFERCPALATAE